MSISKNKNSFAVFGLLFGASAWGVIWYPFRLLEEAGISGIAASFYTYGIALLIACLVFAKQWRGLFAQPKNIIWLILAAGWTNLSYVLAVIDGEVMRVMLLFYLSPVWTLVLAHFWLKEHTGFKGVVVICISLLGAYIMLYDSSRLFPLPSSQSDWLGLSSGMAFSLTNVITHKSTHLSIQAKSFSIWVGVVMMSLVCMLLFGGNFPSPSTFTNADWGIILLVSLVLFASALLVQYGVTHIAATRASIIFLFEIVVAAIATYFLAGEVMSANEWVGGVLIVLAAIYSATSSDGQAAD